MTTGTATITENRSHLSVVVICVGIVVAMAGLAYAAVPLYRLFCQITGFGGTTQRVEVVEDVPVLDREITVRFDANVSNGLDWQFKPTIREVTLKLGERNQISYTAENMSDKPITGTATFNVTPQYAGVYFNKIECFCFTRSTLMPGEKIDMPVVFFIDPELDKEEIMKNLKTITLSYTFFPIPPDETPVAGITGKIDGKVLN